MSNVDVTRDSPPIPPGSVDPDVKVPDSVKRAAALAESFYSKTPPKPADAPEPAPPAPAAEAPPADAPVELKPIKGAPATEPEPEPEPRPQPVSVDAETRSQPEIQPDHKDVTEESWQHRYLSMQGRFQASQRSVGSLQQQMQELGDELMRTQQLVQNQQVERTSEPPKKTFITPEDEAAYGPELIDLATRAARQAVGPELDTLKNENKELKQRVATKARQEMFGVLDGAVPTWREINRDQRFISWLRLPDVYSRRVRQSMLTEAYQAADAPTVLAFFNGFLKDETATGNAEPAPRSEPQPAPRTAAVPLASLAAPGRARPATGDTPGPADKPVFTRVQIQKFYTDVRKGVYAGRDTDKARDEQAIFAAQREGRVRG